jgi:hypothetical protein
VRHNDAQYITQRRLLHLTLVGVFGIKLVLMSGEKCLCKTLCIRSPLRVLFIPGRSLHVQIPKRGE